ncbi:MAG: acyltransferase family protein [Candidatus Ornithomonoglobus sp.]
MKSAVKTRKYNYCLDFIKGIACICVVLMHCEFPGALGTYIQTISRFCVPFFFMVSGYFCFYEGGIKAKSRVLKIKHIFKITIAASVFYVLVAVTARFVFGEEGALNVSLRNIFNLIVFNEPVVIAGQLWFMFALLYVYIMYAIIEKLKLVKLAYCFIPILIAVYIAAAQGAHLIGISIPNFYYRNFLIEGFPLFMLGHWIHRNKAKLQFSNNILTGVVILSTLLCVVERYLMGRDFGINIVTFPQVTALLLYGINNPEKHSGIIQRLGKSAQCSYIYYIRLYGIPVRRHTVL